MKHSIGNTRRVLQASVSAAAIALGSSAFAQEIYTLDQSWSTGGASSGTLDSTALNEAIVAAVEGATARSDQTAVSQVNPQATKVDIDLGDIYALDQGVTIDQSWTQSAANVTGALTILGDALAGGSQIAAVSVNTASLDAIGTTEILNLTQGLATIENGVADLSLTATNAMIAGASFLGTAVVDGGFYEFAVLDDSATKDTADGIMVNGDLIRIEDATEAEIDSADDFYVIAGKTFDDKAVLPAGAVLFDDIQSSQQLAAVSLNTADFITETGDLLVNLETPQLTDITTFDGQNVRVQAENLALAYAPRSLGDNSDPRIANLDQIAALTFNTLSFGVAEVDAADYELRILGATDENFESGQSFNATGTRDFFVYNTAIATTITADAGSDQTPTDYWTGLQGQDEFDELINPTLPGSPNVVDGFGDVTFENGSQVAAITINTLSNLSDGDLKITTDQSQTGFFSGNFNQAITNIGDLSLPSYNGDDSMNQVFGSTLTGDIDVTGYEQIAVFQGNILSSEGSLILGENADFNQIADNVNLSFEGADTTPGFGAFSNNMRLSTDTGDIDVIDVSQIAQTNVNSISAGSDYQGETLTQTITGGRFDVLNAFDARVASNGAVDVDGLDQIAVLNLNSASLGIATGDAFAGGDSGSLTQTFDNSDVTPTQVGNIAAVGTDFASSSLDNLEQVAFASINDVSSSSMTDLNVTQSVTGGVNLSATNVATATVDVGSSMIAGRVATIDNSTQTAFSRINAISID